MATFDPDAYLAQNPVAFDPDAYLSQKPTTPATPVNPIDQIPGTRRVFEQPRERPGLLGSTLGGIIETPIALGSAIVGGIPTYLSGAFGPKVQQSVANALIYQPRTQMAQNALDLLGKGIEASKLPPIAQGGGLTNALTRGMGPAVTAVSDATGAGNVVRALREPLALGEQVPVRQERLAAAKVASSFENSARIEAAQKANDLGIALNPAVSNPTKGNKIRAAISGNKDVNSTLAAANEPKWTSLGKQEMGIPETMPLEAKAFELAREKVSGPYNQIKSISSLTPDGDVLASIEKLRTPALIGGEAAAGKVSALVDDAISKINRGMSGDLVVENIRKQRAAAQSVYNAQKTATVPIDPALIAEADARMGIANALETLVESNLSGKALADFKAARVAMAKTYAYEKATDFNTKRIDPLELAKVTASDNSLTGVIADMGQIAGNFPDIAKVGATRPAWQTHLTRSGPAGTIGFGLGSLVGQPFAGAVVGAGVGEVAGAIGAKRMLTPSYQAAHAVPLDYRLGVNNLRPATPVNPPNAMVPYDFAQSTVLPGEMPYRPDFIFGRPEVNVQATGVPQGPPQLGAPSAESTLQGVQQRRVFDYNMQSALAQQQEQAAAAQQAATRQPTGRGVQYVFDATTGKMIPEAQVTAGMTPNVQVIESTGHNLQSASVKAASNQPFAMSAAEKVAWNKTKVDLAAVDPGFAKLTDKQIAGKMMDRQWIQDTVTKARQQAAAFDQIAQNAKDAQQIRNASAARERMIDLAESMEEQLRAPRPVSGTGQGPKTRAAIRNKLAPTTDVNALTRE